MATTAKMLREVAEAAQALAPQLDACSADAETLDAVQQCVADAEAEAKEAHRQGTEARTKLLEAEEKIISLQQQLLSAEEVTKKMRDQLLRASDGFEAEVRLLEQEVNVLRARLDESPGMATVPDEPLEDTEVVFATEGPLGIEFVHTYAPYMVESVVTGSTAEMLGVKCGDVLLEVGNMSTSTMLWEDLSAALSVRPVSVRISKGRPGRPSSKLVKVVRSFTDWTRGGKSLAEITRAATSKAISVVQIDLDGGESDAMTSSSDVADESSSAEARNAPFLSLVHTSMRAVDSSDTTFESWLRNFHSERNDEWYAQNYVRVRNAFRPIWDEVHGVCS